MTIGPLDAQTKFYYPVTEKGNTVDQYFGIKVPDPYRWLEDDRSEKTAEWVKAENTATEKYLSQVPFKDKIKQRLTQIWNYNKQSAPFKKGNSFFCYKNNGLQNQNVLYKQKALQDDMSEILLDPNALSNDGTVSLSDISISKNGKTLAYGISKAGSDWVEIHFKDIETKKDLPDVIKWVKFSGMSWKGNGIYYSRYNEPTGSALSQKNQFHKVYFHQLGTKQEKDILVFEDKNNPDYNFGAQVSEDENYLSISISQSTSGDKLLIKDLLDPKAKFVTVADNFDSENHVIDNIGKTFYMLTNNGAARYRLVSFTLASPQPASWKTIIPESQNLMEGARLCNNKIVINYLEYACSKLSVYDLAGKLEHDIRLPGICKLSAFNSDKTYDFATYSIAQYTGPEQIYYLDAKTWESKLIFKPESKFESAKYITKQVFFPSKGGTKISMFITYRNGLQINSETPCFVYSYGGFNISLSPEFRIDRAIFLEAGGIYCVPNIRGGG
ncbi:MAG: S9 family peptidase, partial [Bacteroidia bacterium]